MYLNQPKPNFSLNIKGRLFEVKDPIIMGILNLTPDSFYDGGIHNNMDAIIKSVRQMINDGATIIDIGAMSSRPYSDELLEEEELSRLKGTLPLLTKEFSNEIFSIDTYRSKIAEFALDNGASIVNDIAAGLKDENILRIAKKYQAPYIAMHMQGTPQDMQVNPNYKNVLSDIMYFFSERMNAFSIIGLTDVIIDPGFGFGKSIKDNFHILKNLNYFQELNCPLLAGISRKSMIYKSLDISPKDALNGTSALHFEALRNGANILRVHDVKEAKEVIDLFKIYQKTGD